jgi:hypothetical protein
MSDNKQSFPTYKGKPLVRSGDIIYYGNMSDPYVVKITIKTKKKIGSLDAADKCMVQLLSTDANAGQKMIDKTSEKEGLYSALDIADIWLERKLNEVK